MADKCFKYQWQVLYQKGGFVYWWDYPQAVCDLLDESRAEKDTNVIEWIWEWEGVEGKPGARTTYHICTLTMQQVHQGKGSCMRPIRRILIEKEAGHEAVAQMARGSAANNPSPA